jgi:DNA-binding MarR family transcriptional regulator
LNIYLTGVAGKLQAEIGKREPFASVEEEVTLNLLCTADRLMGHFELALRPLGLTPTQYNVLRILRGLSPQGVACQEIARRMITRDADLTRLLDRLETRGLLTRQRQSDDRRVVHIHIAADGMELLAKLDPIIGQINRSIFAGFELARMTAMVEDLERLREQLEREEKA